MPLWPPSLMNPYANNLSVLKSYRDYHFKSITFEVLLLHRNSGRSSYLAIFLFI